MVLPFLLAGEAINVADELAPRSHIFANSDCLASATYAAGALTIIFQNGGTAAYPANPDLYDALISAPSPGEFYNAEIKASRGRSPSIVGKSLAAKALTGLLRG